MFVADYFIRKEGEARVVDQQQVVRDRLDQWLKSRPSADDLAESGILGRGPRFAFARDVVDKLLRARLQAQAAEIARIPPGSFNYTDRMHELLADVGGDNARGTVASRPRVTLEEQLASVRSDRQLAQQALEAADARWSQAATTCQKAVCTGALDSAAETARSALQLLEAHRTSTGQSLAEIFADLQALQRLAARKSCLESIIKVVDKTDKVRKAVFACRGADSVPLDMLEEIPVLCAALPSRSKAIGARRVQFLIGPLRTMLWNETQEALKKTCQWPVDPKIPAMDNLAAVASLLRVCADLHRTQLVSDALRIPRCSNDETDGNWICCALASPLIKRFRYHFWRPESELCKMDKPEWAFKYLLDNSSEYGTRLAKWTASLLNPGGTTGEEEDGASKLAANDVALKPEQVAALNQLNLPAELALAMASEARLFVRARMLTLAQPEARSVFLHTLERLIRFRRDIGDLGGSAAQATVFADFDANRPLEVARKEAPRNDSANGGRDLEGSTLSPAAVDDQLMLQPDGQTTALAKSPGEEDGGFMGGLSHLRKAESSPAADDAGGGPGFMGGLSHLRKAESSASADDAGGGGFMSGLSHLRKAEAAGDSANDRSKEPEDKSASGIGKVGANLMAGLSRFKKTAAAAAPTATVADAVEAGLSGGDRLLSGLSTFADNIADDLADAGVRKAESSPGFLDVWATADAEFINEKLAPSLLPDGSGWRRRPLNKASSTSSSGPRDATSDAALEEPEVAEFSILFKDLFDKACSRAECLTVEDSRKLYSVRVLDPGLQKTVSAIRERWNATTDPVKESRFAALLVETLQDICLFLDSFPLSKHINVSIDDANAMRLGMIDKLVDRLVDTVRPELRRLHTDACVFSYSLGPPLAVLLKRLRPSTFQKVIRKCLADLADMLLKHLLRHSPFTDKEEIALFDANCKDDLGAILVPLFDAEDLKVVQPLWDGCALLALSDAQAADVLASLRHVAKCSPSHALDSLDMEEPESLVEPGLEVPVVGEVLRERRAEVFAKAGIKDLPVTDAIAVLSKRPELVGAMSDLQEAAAFGMLQDLGAGALQLGAGALQHSHLAQATLSLGAGALQQLHMQAPLPSTAAAAAASAATATLQTGLQTGVAAAAELRSLLPGRLIGQVRSTLGSATSK